MPNLSDTKRFVFIFASTLALWFAFLQSLGGIARLATLQYDPFIVFIVVIGTSVLCAVIGALMFQIHQLREVIERRDNLPLDAVLGVSRIEVNYMEMCRNLEDRLWLLGISLPFFRTEVMLERIRHLCIEGVEVKILLANPVSSALAERPGVIYNETQVPAIASAETLRTLWRLKSESLGRLASQNLKLGVMPRPPTIGVVIADNTVLWSPFLLTDTGAKSPYLRHNRHEISKKIISHFETVWAISLHLEERLDLEVLKCFDEECDAKLKIRTNAWADDVARILQGGRNTT